MNTSTNNHLSISGLQASSQLLIVSVSFVLLFFVSTASAGGGGGGGGGGGSDTGVQSHPGSFSTDRAVAEAAASGIRASGDSTARTATSWSGGQQGYSVVSGHDIGSDSDNGGGWGGGNSLLPGQNGSSPQPIQLSSTITGSNCTIAVGENTCNNTSVTWSYSNIGSNSTRVRNTTTNTTYSTSASGNNQSFEIQHGNNTVAAQVQTGGSWSTPSNGSVTLTASCDPNLPVEFAGGNCRPEAPGLDMSLVVNGSEYPQPTTGPSGSASNPIIIVPNDTVQVRWETDGTGGDGTSCEAVGSTAGITSTAGTATQPLSSLTLGESRTYGVRCRRTIDGVHSPWSTETVTVRMADVSLDLSVAQNIVRAGNTTDFTWTATLDVLPTDPTNRDGVFPMDCRIIGGFPSAENPFNPADSSYTDGPGLASNTVESNPLFNFFRSRFECTETVTSTDRSAETEIEVIPSTQER